ncbi:hypothetical protein RG47T_1871 [Mucilaginibacter polytrichastri]|uniref:Uncharacterized protein n=1 Tax=Mucilaginibacter polytrichastri TaxID=1302689 RepID=A0A1Q5ZXB4_9SPHI|nr:hypothetical protein RG47T_1871 [Mucilaginibacter polytrichastri]
MLKLIRSAGHYKIITHAFAITFQTYIIYKYPARCLLPATNFCDEQQA